MEKIGIRGKNEINPQLKTLEELMIENGHTQEQNMILKIDVETAEWNSLNDLPENILTQFKYIIIEYHFLNKTSGQLYYNVIKKLSKNHQPFYLRCNYRYKLRNFGNNRICTALEVSYVIKKDHTFTVDDEMYPIFELDYVGPQNINYTEFNINLLKLFSD